VFESKPIFRQTNVTKFSKRFSQSSFSFLDLLFKFISYNKDTLLRLKASLGDTQPPYVPHTAPISILHSVSGCHALSPS